MLRIGDLGGIFFALFLAYNPVTAEAQFYSSELNVKVLRGLSDEIGIKDICCGLKAIKFPTISQKQFSTEYGEGPIWLKIEVSSQSGLIQFSPVIDEITLFTRTKGEDSWQIIKTGDVVSNKEKHLPTPFMVLPLPQNVETDTIYAKILQPTKVSVTARLWTVPAFAAMQDRDRVTKTFLLGFICAIVLYNVVVTLFVRDPVFILNAACIGSLLVTSLYLSGYGVVYFWPEWFRYSNEFFYVSCAAAILFGSAFFFLFLYSTKDKVRSFWPLFLAPAILLFVGLILLALQMPYWMFQLTTLICAAIFFASAAPLSVFRAIRGDRKARIILFPIFLAMIPGLSLVALSKIFGYNAYSLGDNSLEITLAFEAILFSLAIASRIRITESENADAATQILKLRERSSKMALMAQDNERRRLAKELHDGVGQEMLIVVSQLKRAALKDSPSNIKHSIKELVRTSSRVLDNLRRISRAMHPASIDHLGFAGTIQSTIDQMNSIEGVFFKWDGAIEGIEFNKDAQLHLVRIIQECFTNVTKHSGASECTLRLNLDGGWLELQIDDNGKGIMEGDDNRTSFGLGLTSLDERINYLNGHWNMDSSETGGLSIKIFVPMVEIAKSSETTDG